MKNLGKLTFIDKYRIKDFRFPKDEIYFSKEEKENLINKLKSATIIGNLEKTKCKIIFRDIDGIKIVETTIWATCEKNIVLKSGILIPIRCIIDVII